jgi:RNA-binding protein with serine-rich domain 1
VQLDTSDETSIVNAAEELKDEAIDLLINNAGIAIHADLAGTTKEDLFHHFEVNSVGPFLTTRAFIPHLKRAVAKNGSSLVAQISSTAGSLGSNVESYGYYAYRTSKSALNTLSLCLAHDLKGDSIGMVILCPGYVITDMNTHSGVITPDESASGLISVIDKVTLADTGKFISYAGESVPW